MSEMIERVAKAILATTGEPTMWDHYAPGTQEHYRSMARAAIEAMREPTAAMIEVGDASVDLDWSLEPGEGLDGVDVTPAWRAMIDAALGTPEEDVDAAKPATHGEAAEASADNATSP